MKNIDEHSPINLIGRFIRFIFTTNSAIWFEKDLTEKFINYKTKIPLEIDISSTNLTIEWLKSQKLNWLIHTQEIETAIKYNHYWPSVSNNGIIIGSIKVGLKKVYIADYDQIVDLPEKTAFIYDTYVLNEKRGKGVAKFLIVESIKYLKSKGFLKVKCHIPVWNKASISAYEHIGFQKTSYNRFFRIFGFKICKVKTLKKYPKAKEHKISQEDISGG